MGCGSSTAAAAASASTTNSSPEASKDSRRPPSDVARPPLKSGGDLPHSSSLKSDDHSKGRRTVGLPAALPPDRDGEGPPPGALRGRRSSVSAASFDPNKKKSVVERVVHEKPAEALERIKASTSGNLLFKHLGTKDRQDVYNAMQEKKVPKGVNLITQGEDGDFFYVVESGNFDIYVNIKGVETKVLEAGPGKSFGELALMYNAPRAATCRAASDAVVWALDRETFQDLVVGNMARKRQRYEQFLDGVPLLEELDKEELHKVADCLVSLDFTDGEVIIRQGDEGEAFFIVVEGKVKVLQTKSVNQVATELQLDTLKEGAYFGEIALITADKRAASIVADGPVTVATLDRAAFERLLGPVKDILARNMEHYRTFEQTLAGSGVILGTVDERV